jgi:hypothetical protein
MNVDIETEINIIYKYLGRMVYRVLIINTLFLIANLSKIYLTGSQIMDSWQFNSIAIVLSIILAFPWKRLFTFFISEVYEVKS